MKQVQDDLIKEQAMNMKIFFKIKHRRDQNFEQLLVFQQTTIYIDTETLIFTQTKPSSSFSSGIN